MAILWCGGEDCDFTGAFTVDTNASHFRAGYARCAIVPTGTTTAISNIFSAVSSCWLSFRLWGQIQVGNGMVGLIDSSSGKGLFMAQNTDVNTGNIGIYKYDGTTFTLLMKESGSSFTGTGPLNRIDIQVANWGASTNVTVYVNGVSKIAWTGDLSFSGTITGINQLKLIGNNNASNTFWISEIIVTDEDVRQFVGLVTMAPTGTGTTDQWTGVFSTINGTTLSDASPVYTNTVAQDEQFNVTDLPTGTFTIKAVKITARSAVSSPTPTATKISLGYNSGGTVAVGSAFTPTVAFAPLEQINATNPVTGNPFLQSEMNALQINLRSS